MASSSVVSELIWHFAGYLKLPPADPFLVKVMLEGGGGQAVSVPYYEGQSHTPGLGDPGELPALNTPLPWLVPAEPYDWHLSPIHRFPLLPNHPDAQFSLALPHALPLQVPAVGSDASGGGDFIISVTYQSGADQELIDVRQVNLMIDNNQVNAPADLVLMNNEHADHLISWMVHEAQDAVPSDLDLVAANTSQLKAFVDDHDSHPLLTQGDEAPNAVQLGQYVNGVLVTDGSDPHQVTNDLFNTIVDAANSAFAGPPELVHGDHSDQSIDHVSVGSNITANDAVLVNNEGLSISLAVLGNYYQTNAIIQTNVFKGIDHFTGDGSTSIDANTIQNIADFQNEGPTLVSGGSGVAVSGLSWTVDVLNGDLLQIHSLIQTNYLSNNNVIFQTSSTGESDVIAGGNTLLNTAQFENLTANYDLIIVEGSYHQANLIYQQNVLLDFNNIDFNGMGLASQSATGGGNSIVNDATINATGNHDYQSFTDDAMSLIQALQSEAGTVDPNTVLSAFPSLFGDIHILIVKGDYYDINYLSQTNVISNSNAVQLSGSPTAPDGATQSVSTGHNITVNSATIVDGGSIESPYLQGNYYNDMILIQTNIIGGNEKIAGQDPGVLAPELVAFTSALDSPDQSHQPTPVVTPSDPQHHDGVATILH